MRGDRRDVDSVEDIRHKKRMFKRKILDYGQRWNVQTKGGEEQGKRLCEGICDILLLPEEGYAAGEDERSNSQKSVVVEPCVSHHSSVL